MGNGFEDRAWLGRVSSATGMIKGAAWAVDGEHLVTCAHVAQNAGAAAPGATVRVDFPLLGVGSDAVVLKEGWAPDEDDGMAGDLALLRLADPCPGLQPLPLRSLRSLDGSDFAVYGFPDGYDTSLYVSGRLGKAVGLERVQLEIDSRLCVEPGFSGAPVWSDRFGAVVGMLTSRHRGTEGRVVFAVPVRTIATHSAIVTAALQTPLDLDRDKATHWGPRSRGVKSDRDADGWLFSGRQRVLSELVLWLADDRPPPLRVVTGTPGSGKSAVLARLVTSADRRYRCRIPDLAPDDPTVPPVDSISVTFHASDRTVREFVAHVAALGTVEVDNPKALLSALDEADERLVIAVDAVDEASEPEELCWLLGDLAARGHRTLVGCRPHLVDTLGDLEPIRLDQPPWLEYHDVEVYVKRLLARSAAASTQAEGLPAEIAAAADGNFLVAQLTAQAVAANGRVDRPFPRNVGQALERLLADLPDTEKARDLLIPLALAYGDGLPTDLWLTAAAALRRPYRPADLDELLSSPASSFLVRLLDATGDRRHRLFHPALAHTLTHHRDRVKDHQTLFDTWTEALPRVSEPSPSASIHSWTDAAPYLRDHAPEHASVAGRLHQLASDTGFLLAGDLHRLLLELARSPTSPVEETALLRLAANRAQPLDSQRRGFLLSLAARHLGLRALADRIADHTHAPWRPAWAHSFGQPHQPLSSHTGAVWAVAVGCVGEHDVIVSAGNDRTVRVWDPASGAPRAKPLTGHTGAVRAVAVGRVGERAVIVSAGDDRTVRVWDASSGAPVGEPLTGHTGAVWAVAVGRVGERAVIVSAGDDRTVRVWDASSGAPVGEPLTGHTSTVLAVAVGRLGERDVIVSAGDDGTVRVWDAASGEPRGQPLRGHIGQVWAVAMGRVGERDVIVSGSGDGTVRVWDANSGAPVGEPRGEPHAGHPDRVLAVAVGRVGERDVIVSGGDDQTVRVWDAASGDPIGEPLGSHIGSVLAVAMGRVGGRDVIVTGSEDRLVGVWDAGDDRAPRRRRRAIVKPRAQPLEGHYDWVRAVAMGRVGERDVIVSGSDDCTVGVWDYERSGHVLRRRRRPIAKPRGEPLRGHANWVLAVAMGRVGKRDVIVSGSADQTVRMWDAISGAPLGEPLQGHTSTVLAVAVGRLGERDVIVSAGEDRTVRVWDAVSGAPRGEPLRGHTDSVRAVAMGRVGERDVIISASGDHTVRLWDAYAGNSLQVLDTLSELSDVAVTAPACLYVACGTAVCRFDQSATPS